MVVFPAPDGAETMIALPFILFSPSLLGEGVGGEGIGEAGRGWGKKWEVTAGKSTVEGNTGKMNLKSP